MLHDLSPAMTQLELLYGSATRDDGLLAIYTKKPYGLEIFAPTAIEEAAAWAWTAAHNTNVFHVVNLLTPTATPGIRKRRGRGREPEVTSIVALVADIDVAGNSHLYSNYPPQAAALDALRHMPLPPSIVNLSGPTDGGLHVYWALESPARILGEQARATAKAISKGWQERLQHELRPYRLDSTFDLVRVLRIAGCANHKYAHAVTRPLSVKEHRYQLEEFARYVEMETPPGDSDPHAIYTANDPRRIARCRAYLERVPAAASGDHGHDKTFRAACECARFGWSQSEAMQVMIWFNQAKTPAADKWTEVELAHKLTTALETVERQGQVGIRLRT